MRYVLAFVAAAIACSSSDPPRPTEPQGPARVRAILDADPSHDGAACLAMTLAAYGKPARVDELQPTVAPKDETANALGIVRAAKAHGLEVAGVKVQREQLTDLRAGDILHFKRSTFAVVERIDGDGLHVIVPTTGAIVIPFATWDEQLSGIAILFQLPGEARFRKHGIRPTDFGSG